MNAKQAKAIAAFLREQLKQGKEAITIVVPRDIIESMYTISKIAVKITEELEEEGKQ